MTVHAKLFQSCLTLCDSMDHSPPVSSVHGTFQARILEWVDMLSSRRSSWPRDPTRVFSFADILYQLSHQGSPVFHYADVKIFRQSDMLFLWLGNTLTPWFLIYSLEFFSNRLDFYTYTLVHLKLIFVCCKLLNFSSSQLIQQYLLNHPFYTDLRVHHYHILSEWSRSVVSTLCDPMDSPVHEILQARIMEWVAIHFSRWSSPRRDWTWVSCTIGRFLTIWVSRMMLLFASHSLLPQSQTIIWTTILLKFS